MGQKIEVDKLTEDETVGLLKDCLDLLPQAVAIVLIRDWITDNSLEDEFGG